jgi:FkbM family methyltransferase
MISYSQNFEDVMLWRALKHVPQGCYIDIGAWDPVEDSVSLAFYEKGWRGIHVEPVEIFAKKLKEARPDEVVIQAVVGIENQSADFCLFEGTGLSTLCPEIADIQIKKGFLVKSIKVHTRTLESIFSEVKGREIHWLKIDVEGMEESVVQSWNKSPIRPWIVVVESTIPGTQIETSAGKEELIRLGYELAYFDGLNRFYVHDSHSELLASFRLGPNIFDGFVYANSRNHQQTAQYQDLRNLVCEGKASVEALKAEFLALAQKRKAQHEAVEKSVGGLKEELAHQRKAQQEAVEKSASEVKREIIAEIHSLIANLVDQGKKDRLEVSARIDSVKDGMEERIFEVAEYTTKIQEEAVSPSSYLIPAPFSWYSYLYKMLDIKTPSWVPIKKRSEVEPKRPKFLRRLERSIRKRRKRLFGRIGFDREWYLQEYPEVGFSDIDPLDHWLRFGVEEGRWKSGRHKKKGLASGELRKKRPSFFRRLEISIRKRRKRLFGRIGFDREWYLQEYPEVGPSGIDPVDHYMRFGIYEGRCKSHKYKTKHENQCKFKAMIELSPTAQRYFHKLKYLKSNK